MKLAITIPVLMVCSFVAVLSAMWEYCPIGEQYYYDTVAVVSSMEPERDVVVVVNGVSLTRHVNDGPRIASVHLGDKIYEVHLKDLSVEKTTKVGDKVGCLVELRGITGGINEVVSCHSSWTKSVEESLATSHPSVEKGAK